MENHQDPDEPQVLVPTNAGPPAVAAGGGAGTSRSLPASPSPITINLIGTMSRAQQTMVTGLLHGYRFDSPLPEPAVTAPPNLNGALPWEAQRRGPGRPPLTRRGRGAGRGVGRGAGRVAPYGVMPQFTVGPLLPIASTGWSQGATPAPPSFANMGTQTPATSSCGRCRRSDVETGILDTCGHIICRPCHIILIQGGAVCPVNGCNVTFNASNFILIRG